MLNVSEAVKQKYLSDEFNGDYELVIGETTYTGRNVKRGSIEIVESLCSGDDFDLSAVEKGEIQFTLINFTENIKDIQGASLTVTQTVAGEDVPLGVYTITDAKFSGEYLLDVKAHDNLTLFDRDVTDWWNDTVVFPITHRNLLIALCNYCGVQYDIPAAYCNSSLSIEKAFDGDSVNGLDLLGWLQEISASFYRCNRYGVLTTRTMRFNNLVPRIGLYPRTGLYPGSEQTDSQENVDQRYTVSQIVSDLEIADYMTKHIDKLQISSSNDDIGVIVGDGTNTYRIVGNPLLYSVDTATLEGVAAAIFQIVHGVNYRPFSAKLKGLPYLEVGDVIQLTTLKGIKILEPILKRTMSGSGLAYDMFECVGKERRETVSAVNKTYKVLNRRFHSFENTVDQLSSTVGNVEQRVTTNETNITQNANAITLQATRSGVFNLLTNSDFSNQTDRIQSWQVFNVATEYVYDENFSGGNSDLNNIENGYCLKITPTINGGCSFYQEINYSGTISEKLTGQVTYKVLSTGGATFRPFIRVFSGSTSIIYTFVGSNFLTDGKTYNQRWIIADSTLEQLSGVEVTKIQYGVFISNGTTSSQVEVNHFLLTFGDSVLPFWSWTNYASKDLISQINIAPSGITIQGEKVDIKGITTFSSSSSETTVIDGGTVNLTNLNASNITSGTINGLTITGCTIQSTTQMVWNYSESGHSGTITAKGGSVSTNLTANGVSYKYGLVHRGSYSSMGTSAPSDGATDAIGFDSYNFVATGRNVYITGQYNNSYNAAGIAVEQADNSSIKLIMVARYGSTSKRMDITKDNIGFRFGGSCWVNCNGIARITTEYRPAGGGYGTGQVAFPCAIGSNNWSDW